MALLSLHLAVHLLVSCKMLGLVYPWSLVQILSELVIKLYQIKGKSLLFNNIGMWVLCHLMTANISSPWLRVIIRKSNNTPHTRTGFNLLTAAPCMGGLHNNYTRRHKARAEKGKVIERFMEYLAPVQKEYDATPHFFFLCFSAL